MQCPLQHVPRFWLVFESLQSAPPLLTPPTQPPRRPVYVPVFRHLAAAFRPRPVASAVGASTRSIRRSASGRKAKERAMAGGGERSQ